MNTDSSSQAPSDKSLQYNLDQMSKASANKEPENNIQNRNCLNPSDNNHNLRNNGIHPQDPRIRLQSNHVSSTPSIPWGRIFPESSSPKIQLKSESQLKKEGEDQDELSKMMMILQWNSQSNRQVSSNILPQPGPPTGVKEEEALTESEKQPSFTLIEQREEYMKKAATLQAKIKILSKRRQELKGDGQRPPSPDTMLLLKDNTKLLLVHQNKLKNINNLIEMLNGMIGERNRDTQNTANTEVKREIKVPPPKRYNYVFYDSELHWCRVCNIFPTTATDYLSHLHSQDHKTKVATAYLEAPWHGTIGDDSFPTHPQAETKRMPIKGLQFFVPSTAWYCKLCDQFIGDLHCASAHLKSVTHSKNYSVFVKENPHWESDWILDRQKAFEDMRLTISLEAVDSFNIESICGKEEQKDEEKVPEKYTSASSSDSDASTVFKAKVKRPKTKDPESEPSVSKKSLKRLEPLIADRKLLDEINSTKVTKDVSPPRAYRDKSEDRRSEARHSDRNWRYDDRSLRHNDRSMRHDDRSLRHDHRSLRHDDRHSMRHDKDRHYDRVLHHDRSWAGDRALDIRSYERSRQHSSERRRERERSEARSLRERSEVRSLRERSEMRSERERSEIRSGRERIEGRSERRRNGHASPVSVPSSPEPNLSEKSSLLVGKITPFKIKNSKEHETKVSNEEDLRKKKEEMDAEIQKKVDEFKKHLIKIQTEIQQKKLDENTRKAPPPAPTIVNTPASTTVTVPAANMPVPGFNIPGMPDTDGLDMDQVVKMASQILQQQAMIAPFGLDPMCMPMPMEGSLLGPPPGLPIMPPSLMRMPFMPFTGRKMPLLQTQNRNRRKKPYEPPASKKHETNQKKESEVSEPLHPPGESKKHETKQAKESEVSEPLHPPGESKKHETKQAKESEVSEPLHPPGENELKDKDSPK
ncbi:zinc finger matrin-type protein CG9776-like [Aricia agestis]|uniref:zinc finger matrin-type protein CG9776-like n=1 Tax=Aricia agestis TaxID=91739 RepID=UPI001C202EE2|nr:zinc finger matrin-type protein CG9776-like [Aricia agestis]